MSDVEYLFLKDFITSKHDFSRYEVFDTAFYIFLGMSIASGVLAYIKINENMQSFFTVIIVVTAALYVIKLLVAPALKRAKEKLQKELALVDEVCELRSKGIAASLRDYEETAHYFKSVTESEEEADDQTLLNNN